MNYGKAIAVCGATLIAAIAVGAAAFPLHAGSRRPVVVIAHPEDYVTQRVSYADLDLAAAPGERTLNRRVGSAVANVCNEAVGGGRTTIEYRSCEVGAWRGARPQIALAVQRAHELAANESSIIGEVAISIAAPQ